MSLAHKDLTALSLSVKASINPNQRILCRRHLAFLIEPDEERILVSTLPKMSGLTVPNIQVGRTTDARTQGQPSSPKYVPAPMQVIKACRELRSEPSPGISLVPSLTDTTQPPGRTDHLGLSPTLQSAATENSRKTQRHLPSSDYSGRRQEFRQHLQVTIRFVSQPN